MNTFRISFLFLALLTLVTVSCTTRPPLKSQADIDTEFTLMTTILDGRMVYVGVGGEIDGMTNPDLTVNSGDRIRITMVNEDGIPHDIATPDLHAQTSMVAAKGETTEMVFEASTTGEFAYYCTVPGHRQAGMEGRLIINEP